MQNITFKFFRVRLTQSLITPYLTKTTLNSHFLHNELVLRAELQKITMLTSALHAIRQTLFLESILVAGSYISMKINQSINALFHLTSLVVS